MTTIPSRFVLTALLALAAVLPAGAADVVNPNALAKARAVLLASAPPEQRTKMLSGLAMQFSRYVGSVNPGRESEVDDLVQTYFVPVINARYSEITDIGAREYAKDFTLPELNQLLAFYQSPLGRKLVDVQGKLDPIVKQQGPVVTRSIVSEAMQKMAPEMKKRGLVMPQ